MILSENRKGNFFSVALPVALGVFSFSLWWDRVRLIHKISHGWERVIPRRTI